MEMKTVPFKRERKAGSCLSQAQMVSPFLLLCKSQVAASHCADGSIVYFSSIFTEQLSHAAAPFCRLGSHADRKLHCCCLFDLETEVRGLGDGGCSGNSHPNAIGLLFKMRSSTAHGTPVQQRLSLR